MTQRPNRKLRRNAWKEARKFADSPPCIMDADPSDPKEICQFATFVFNEQVIFLASWQVADERILNALKQKYPTKGFVVSGHDVLVVSTPKGDFKMNATICDVII